MQCSAKQLGRALPVRDFVRVAVVLLAFHLTLDTALAGAIDPGLSRILDSAPEAAYVPVIVTCRTPGQGLDPRTRRASAELASHRLLSSLDLPPVRNARNLWVIDSVALEATPDTIRTLASREDVLSVREDTWNPGEKASIAPASENGSGAWNLECTGAPRLWADGITGSGIRVGMIDTGIDTGHPDLKDRLVAGAWFDAVNRRTTPYDDNGHGTHVAGIICGGAATGTPIGVAPGAHLLVAKGLDFFNGFRTSWVIEAGQWMLDPNGDGDPSDAAQIVNCSWSFGDPLRMDFRPVLEAWRDAGIWAVFAAGNKGPTDSTVASPSSDPLVLSVGATNEADGIAEFSGRGPAPLMAPWNGAGKPDLCAPGVMIYSAARAGKYAVLSGTSGAAPHVSGALALLRQAYPAVGFESARARLLNAAVDIGPPGPDTGFGNGRLDAYEAVKMAEGNEPPALFGRVLSAMGDPIPDAVVEAAGSRTLTDPDGRFRMNHVANGTWPIVADAAGFAPASAVTATGIEADITLLPRGETAVPNGNVEKSGGWTAGGPPGGTVRSFLINRTPGGMWSLGVYSLGDGAERFWQSGTVPVRDDGWTRVSASYAWRGIGDANGRLSALVWEDALGNTIRSDYGTPFVPATRGGSGDAAWRVEAQAFHAMPPTGARAVRLRLGAVFAPGDRSSVIHFDDAMISLASPSGLGAPGDADGDGAVTMADAAFLVRAAGGMQAATLRSVSAVGGPVDLPDAARVARVVTGLADLP